MEITQEELAAFLLDNADLLSSIFFDRDLLAIVKMQVVIYEQAKTKGQNEKSTAKVC